MQPVLTVLVILAVLGILFGAAVLATYEGDVLRDPHPDDRAAGLPPTQLQPEDVAELRFDMALRGYRMSEVDEAMARLGAELATRDARIAQLEQALVDVVEPAVVAAEQDAAASAQLDIAEAPFEQTYEPFPPAAVEAYEPLEPPAAAPAVISGPLTATTWFTDPAPEPVDVPAMEPEPVASAQVDTAPEVAEQTQEPEHAPEPEPEPVASAQVDLPPAQEEQTQQPEHEEPSRASESLTLTTGDDAFSFPELQLPDPADESPEPSEPPSDWWTSEPQDRP